jgi:hypothetical protein
MHWLAMVLSDHPYQDLTRDAAIEEAPRRGSSVPGSWRSLAAVDAGVRPPISSRCVSPLVKPVGAVLS